MAESDKIARAITEIEEASAELRQAEPALDAWSKPQPRLQLLRNPESIWTMMIILWLASGLVVAGTVFAIAHFIR
jgi:hypothetical protein